MANAATVRRRPTRWLSRLTWLLARLVPFGPAVPLAGAVWYVQTFNPADQTHDPLTGCAWHALFGMNGPSCGGTRAFYYLIHADIVHAVQNYLPLVVGAPFVLYWWATWVAADTFGVRLPALRFNKWVFIGFGIASLVFTTVLRNLPIAPFSWFDIPDMTPRIW